MRADVSFEDHEIPFSCFKSDKDRILFFLNTITVIAQFLAPNAHGFLKFK